MFPFETQLLAFGERRWPMTSAVNWRKVAQHSLENMPAKLRRLFEGRNEGNQLLRAAE